MRLLTDVNVETNIFGIILLPDQDTSARVEQLRALLSDEPVRAEVPHAVLLRGISSEARRTDAELLRDTRDLLCSIVNAAYLGWVERVHAVRGRLYGKSSVAELRFPDGLAAERQRLIKDLEARGYAIEAQEFQPHMVIGLGATLPQDADTSDILPGGHDVQLVDYAILRLSIKDSKPSTRLVRELWRP